MNKVILMGRLGKDPEIKYTGSGAAVANFSVATDESYKDKSGNWQKKAEWHNVVAWNKQAERCAADLHKGSFVAVVGKLQTQKWEDKAGNKRSTVQIFAESVNFLEPKEARQAEQGSSPEPQANDEITDDDIPF